MKLELFEYEDMFKKALQEGIALFCGAGFSVEAQNENGDKLPIGKELLENLKHRFIDISAYSNLPRACTKLEKVEKEMFHQYLESRFCVSDFNPLYNELLKIKINGIYTTNIDDLFFHIYDSDEVIYYLNNCSIKGKELNDKYAIPYYPLHGCVRERDKGYVFGLTEIASAFSEQTKENAWKHLTREVSDKPVLFWGWNFEDAGPIEAMYGEESNIGENIYRWVLLHHKNEEMIDFLHSLNFNIIVGDTLQLLEYIKELNIQQKEKVTYKNSFRQNISYIFSEYMPPANDKELISYPFEEYFIEYSPRWSYVYSHQIYKTEHYVRRRITIGCNSKLKSRLTPIRPRGLACNCTFLSA